MWSRGKRQGENMEAVSWRLTSKLIYNERIEDALHRKRTTRKYPTNTDALRGKIFKIWMHVSSKIGLKMLARGKSATVKVIGRPKIRETKRNQVGAQLATDWVDKGERTGLTFRSRSSMQVCTPCVEMTSVKNYAHSARIKREKNTDAFWKQGELLGTLMKTSVAWNIEPFINLENLKKKTELGLN